MRAVIVEDEPHARRILRELATAEEIDVVGEAADGESAVRLIDALQPDLLFLDVRLPELSGIEVLERVRHAPPVIFTTAFDRYAVPAFELQAIDYLLKPFSPERFRTAVARAKGLRGDSGDVLPRVRAAVGAAPLTRLFLRRRDRIVAVALRDVVRFEAAGDYVEVHAHDTTYLAGCALAVLQTRLDPSRFVRIHRSHIVNVERIASMTAHDERRLLVTMSDGSTVIASRTGSAHLRALVL